MKRQVTSPGLPLDSYARKLTHATVPSSEGSLIRVAAWIVATLIVACAVWQRIALSTEFFCILFVLLCTAALWWDLKIELCKAGGSLRFIIAPLLFVASV